MRNNKKTKPARSKLLTATEHLDNAISDLLAHAATTTTWESNPGPGRTTAHSALLTLAELVALRDRVRSFGGVLNNDPIDKDASLLR